MRGDLRPIYKALFEIDEQQLLEEFNATFNNIRGLITQLDESDPEYVEQDIPVLEPNKHYNEELEKIFTENIDSLDDVLDQIVKTYSPRTNPQPKPVIQEPNEDENKQQLKRTLTEEEYQEEIIKKVEYICNDSKSRIKLRLPQGQLVLTVNNNTDILNLIQHINYFLDKKGIKYENGKLTNVQCKVISTNTKEDVVKTLYELKLIGSVLNFTYKEIKEVQEHQNETNE